MTCKELRWYFEDHLRDAEVRSARGAVVEHISTCVDCSRFVAQQRDLGKNLRWLRESAPEMSQSLDESVVLNYRRNLAQRRERFALPGIDRFPVPSRWTWSAIAVAALLAISLGLLSARLLSARKTGSGRPPETTRQPTLVPHPQAVARNCSLPTSTSLTYRQESRQKFLIEK